MNEQSYLQIIKNAPIAIYVFQDGKLKFVNDAFLKFSGYSSGELAQINYLDLIHPDFRKELVGQTELALGGNTSSLSTVPEIKVLRKNGEVRWAQIRPCVVEFEKRPAVLGAAIDTTEQKLDDEMVRQSEKLFRVLAERASDVTWIVEAHNPSRLIYVSPSIKHLLGYTVEEAMSRTMEQTFSPSSLQTMMNALANTTSRKGPGRHALPKAVTLELQMNRKDCSEVPVEIRYNLIPESDGRPACIIGVARDISERKRVEAERLEVERKAQIASRLTAIGEMAAGVAHEINNPLTSIMGFSEFASQQDLPAEIKKDLAIIRDSSQRVADVVAKLMLFARQAKPRMGYTKVNELISNTVELRRSDLQASNIEIVMDLAEALPAVLADAGQLQLVFLNLISNAQIEMSQAHGKGTLFIRTELVNNSVLISFKDDGPGISREHMSRLFLPFFTTRDVGKGSGLGLSVCHGVMAEHKGRIWAESEPEKGATFFVTIPVETAQDFGKEE